jgi:hypothetical protein
LCATLCHNATVTEEAIVAGTVEETEAGTAVGIAVVTVVETEAEIEATVPFAEEIAAIVVQADVVREAAHGEGVMADEDGVGMRGPVDLVDMEAQEGPQAGLETVSLQAMGTTSVPEAQAAGTGKYRLRKS